MELRVLHYFVVLAEELHFSRAATRLAVAQPSLSYAIKALEQELGVALFERDRRHVSLTEAGDAVLIEARRTLAQAKQIHVVAEQYHAKLAGMLRVGFEATGAGPIGAAVQARMAQEYPDVKIIPKRFDWGAEVDALRRGIVDVAYVWLPAQIEGLHTEVIASESRFVALPLAHPLAARSQLRIMELADEPLMWTRSAPKAWVDWWAVNPRPDGREPVWGPTNENAEEMLEQVAAGRAICFAPASMSSYYARPDLAWRPIVDIEPLHIALAWRVDERNPLIEHFVSIVRQVQSSSRNQEL
ncbi:LysR family transcriptional regulator [Ktedonospora formicarum]|uniref:Putative transcriptional regulator, LysR family protein n=1 Tax=Ktedonospora formicarum TaxID=2778364 RepID=A0A8J3I899_9CHLR|nr:LysR family transcriptional regulator [Ktedonospora formicarum]GHO47628.1 putative transcriptional regulator, LysR family protein [Ktedonospora formicarum]